MFSTIISVAIIIIGCDLSPSTIFCHNGHGLLSLRSSETFPFNPWSVKTIIISGASKRVCVCGCLMWTPVFVFIDVLFVCLFCMRPLDYLLCRFLFSLLFSARKFFSSLFTYACWVLVTVYRANHKNEWTSVKSLQGHFLNMSVNKLSALEIGFQIDKFELRKKKKLFVLFC